MIYFFIKNDFVGWNLIDRYGYKTPLEDHDVWLLASSDHSKTIHSRLEKNWQSEIEQSNKFMENSSSSDNSDKENRKPSMLRALRKTFGYKFFLAWIFKFGNDASQFVGPMLLQ